MYDLEVLATLTFDKPLMYMKSVESTAMFKNYA
jgi:hypothetical protein